MGDSGEMSPCPCPWAVLRTIKHCPHLLIPPLKVPSGLLSYSTNSFSSFYVLVLFSNIVWDARTLCEMIVSQIWEANLPYVQRRSKKEVKILRRWKGSRFLHCAVNWYIFYKVSLSYNWCLAYFIRFVWNYG